MLEVSVEQTLLSEFILRSVSGGVTTSTIPYMTDENLAKVHRTPLVSLMTVCHITFLESF